VVTAPVSNASQPGTEKPSGFGVDHENHEALREKVARIVDPTIYRIIDLGARLSDEGAARLDEATTKADAILAALQSKGGEP